jgi:deoxyribodipyrimidine photo-lyase
MTRSSIVWLRNDLRLADNPALAAAVRTGAPVTALFIHETTEGMRPPGAAARWWLHQSLAALEASLAAKGIALTVAAGDARELLPQMARDAGAVFWNRRYAPGERQADAAIKTALRAEEIAGQSCPGNVLVEPWDIATGQGRPYSVFTPFWKALRSADIASPLHPPEAGQKRRAGPVDADYRQPRWAEKLAAHWQAGESAAQQKLADFLYGAVTAYPEGRDYPAKQATSMLSPHLRFGEISPRQVWHAALAMAHADPLRAGAIDKFLSELAWRDFSYHQLYHRPDIAQVAMQPRYAGMRWRDAPDDLAAWQAGRTGLPIVDAGMRELWATGYMQNRVRMLCASLLTKNLLIDWRLGEQWFWDCLVDADSANNPASWQWVSGSGLDASPYFRIFNPVTQGERFDRDGDYVRRWVPELAGLGDAWLHHPWEAPENILESAGVRLGETYPRPIVDLKVSRLRALDASRGLRAE